VNSVAEVIEILHHDPLDDFGLGDKQHWSVATKCSIDCRSISVYRKTEGELSENLAIFLHILRMKLWNGFAKVEEIPHQWPSGWAGNAAHFPVVEVVSVEAGRIEYTTLSRQWNKRQRLTGR